MTDFVIYAFATLFVTIDPVGLAPMFLAVTSGYSKHDRQKIAIRATITAFVILLVFFVSGNAILQLLGISVSAFRVAGGVLLFLIAVEMIFGKRQKRKSETAEKAVEEQDPTEMQEIAIFPLAIPLIAGPAAISAIILLSGQAPDTLAYVALGFVILTILAACALTFLLADQIERLLGDTAQMVITRLLGVLLSAMSVQFIADGVFALMKSHT